MEIQSALADLKTTEQKLEIEKIKIKQAEDALRIAEERYRNGLLSATDLIDAQNALESARLNCPAARLQPYLEQIQSVPLLWEENMKIGRIIIVLILVALAAFVGYRANQNIQAKKKAASQPAPETIVPVEAVRPRPMEIAEKIHAVGGIQSDAEVSIFSKVSGKIANNLVKMGSVVQPGQVVSVVNRDEVGYDYKPYEVKSDAKGVVARILLNPGASVNPNSPIMNLVDIDMVKVVAAVDEKKIRFIGMGQGALVTLEAYPGEVFAARVTNISPVANPVNRTIDVELSIPNPDHRIKPGMYAEVEWIDQQADGDRRSARGGRRPGRPEIRLSRRRRPGQDERP